MSTVNFNQLICKNISIEAQTISGIFDTLVCEKGTNTIFLCVIASQILDYSDNKYDRYYYRIVLRQLDSACDDMKNYRVDSGIVWDNASAVKHDGIGESQSKHKTTRSGSTNKIVIEYEHNYESQGHYEVDLYVKKMEDFESQATCDSVKVKDLELVSLCPFQVIFANNLV